MHFFYFFALLPSTRFSLFFEASLVTAVLSIFCIPLLFRSSLLLSFEILLRCDSFRYSPQLFAARFLACALRPSGFCPILFITTHPSSHPHSNASHTPIVSHFLSARLPHQPSNLYRFSASYFLLSSGASDPPPSLTYLNHSHFPSFSSATFPYTLSLLIPESLFLSLLSHPIAYRHSPLLSFPAFSNCPQRSISQTLESFPTSPTSGIFCRSLSSILEQPLSARVALHRLQPHARMFFCMFLEVFYDLS